MSAPAKGPARLREPLPPPEETMLPRVGMLRLGVKETNAKGVEFPRAIDYFRVEKEESEITSDAAVEAFRARYGVKPKVIRVMLVGKEVEDNIEIARRLYGTSKLKIRCDGVTCSERTATGDWVTKPCVCDAKGLAEDHKLRCKRTATLNLVLPDVTGIGAWQLSTGSDINIHRTVGFLRLIRGLAAGRAAAAGTEDVGLAGYECDLGLVSVKVAPRGIASTVIVLDWRDFGRTPRQALAAGNGHEPKALPAPVDDEREDDLLRPDPPEPTVRDLIGAQITEKLGEADRVYIKDRFAATLGAAVDGLLAYGEDEEIGPLLVEDLAAALVLIREREDAEVNGANDAPAASERNTDLDEIPF